MAHQLCPLNGLQEQLHNQHQQLTWRVESQSRIVCFKLYFRVSNMVYKLSIWGPKNRTNIIIQIQKHFIVNLNVRTWRLINDDQGLFTDLLATDLVPLSPLRLLGVLEHSSGVQ